jgi:hypothetical protein
LPPLCAREGLQEERVSVTMRHVLEALHSQRLYYKATETGLEQLVKLARRNEVVRKWLYVHRHLWAWAPTWLEQNLRPPPAYYSNYPHVRRDALPVCLPPPPPPSLTLLLCLALPLRTPASRRAAACG